MPHDTDGGKDMARWPAPTGVSETLGGRPVPSGGSETPGRVASPSPGAGAGERMTLRGRTPPSSSRV